MSLILLVGGVVVGGVAVGWRVRQNTFLAVSDVDPAFFIEQQKYLLLVGDRLVENKAWAKVFRHQRRLVARCGIPRGAMRHTTLSAESLALPEPPAAIPAPDNIYGRTPDGRFQAKKGDLDEWNRSRGYRVGDAETGD